MTRTFDVQDFARGLHELLVLGLLQSGARHGYQIVLDLAETSGGLFEFSHGTLYPILHRLEAAGHIAGSWTEGGRPRRVYRLTAQGRRALQAERDRVDEVLRGLGAVLDGTGGDAGSARAG